MTRSEAHKKLQKFCAYQERSPFEVERKLYALGLPREFHEEVVAALMEEGFLDEYRFAEAYIQGKMNQKHWAPRRIRLGLQEHRIPEVTIQRLFEKIEAEVIENNAYYLVDRWFESKTKEQLTAALQRRGYDYHLITATYDRVNSERSA